MAIGTVQAEGQTVSLHILTTTYDVGRGHIRHAPSRDRMPVVEIDGNIISINASHKLWQLKPTSDFQTNELTESKN